tara:strand:+ start:48 stop:311 length:264 start_codon:yes stop_codon:yes gene_type:complete
LYIVVLEVFVANEVAVDLDVILFVVLDVFFGPLNGSTVIYVVLKNVKYVVVVFLAVIVVKLVFLEVLVALEVMKKVTNVVLKVVMVL